MNIAHVRSPWDWLREQAYADPDALRPVLQRIADELHADGTISDAIYKGATGPDHAVNYTKRSIAERSTS